MRRICLNCANWYRPRRRNPGERAIPPVCGECERIGPRWPAVDKPREYYK